MIEFHVRPKVQPLFDLLGKHLLIWKITPNTITACAFILGILSAVSISLNFSVIALALLWLSGLCDVLDGTIARLSNQSNPFGAYCDLISDRMVEAALIIGFAFQYPQHYMSYLLFLTALIFHFSAFLAAGALFKNNGPKSMHYDRSIVERVEAFMVFSCMLLFPLYISTLLLFFTTIMFASGVNRLYRVKIYHCDLALYSKKTTVL